MKITYVSRGLGDTVDKITTYTGIKPVVKAVAKAVTGDDDCGCEERRKKLNEMFPYNNTQAQDGTTDIK
jgi:hypothetical protein